MGAPGLRALLAASIGLTACAPAEPFAARVVSFQAGEGAGFGQDALPEVVLGPPQGGGASQGSTDVVSLGQGGVIVLELGADAEDGPGPDLLVFENPFMVATTGDLFAEPGEVAVSEDAATFVAFPCAAAAPAPNGCAGYGVVLAGADNGVDPTEVTAAGGDAFDLADVGLARARFVRITDRAAEAGNGAIAPTAGFDLDAVAVVGR
ncbi:MAG: hypothetical protein A2138_24815 [Deltaproteobacteria bacterium RBG_16_71_12]|nr:MAG: hypothetical protein A2138_24815 [Deltaproteobacteria bacterium RBG_16_71_12]